MLLRFNGQDVDSDQVFTLVATEPGDKELLGQDEITVDPLALYQENQRLNQELKTLQAELDGLRAQVQNQAAQAAQETDKDALIRRLALGNLFAASPFLRERTVLTPDIAMDAFGKYFTIRFEGETPVVEATLNGETIMSKADPGKPAGFEEAIEVLVNAYALKDAILKPNRSGSGAAGNLAAPMALPQSDEQWIRSLFQ